MIRSRQLRFAPIIAAAALLSVLIYMMVFPRIINGDIGLYLEIANKLLDGERPYVDYEEINFPMIHYINIVPAALGRWLGITPTAPLIFCVLLAAVLSYIVIGRLLRAYKPDLGGYIAWAQISIVLISTWIYLRHDWGQREHLFVLALIPWLIVRTRRYHEDHFVGKKWFIVGFIAGIGTALKPHFALIILLPELFLAISKRRIRLMTPEVIGMACVAVLHVVYFLTQPDILAAFLATLNEVARGYAGFGFTPFTTLITSPLILSYLVLGTSVVIWYAINSASRPAPLIATLGCALIGSAIVFAVQQKGWLYHRIHADFFAVMLLAWVLYELITHTVFMQNERYRRLVLIPVAAGALAISIIYTQQAIRYYWRIEGATYQTAPIIEAYTSPGERVLILDPSIYPTNALLPTLNRRHASSYASAYPIPLAYFGHDAVYPYDDPRHVVPTYAQTYLDRIAEDIDKHQPNLIGVISTRCEAGCEVATDFHDYLYHRGFIEGVILPNYSRLTEEGGYIFYKRTIID